MEYCAGGAIKSIMQATQSTMTENQAKEVISYTLLALHHIHSKCYLHRVSRC
jgi:serine/threonine protein kinase